MECYFRHLALGIDDFGTEYCYFGIGIDLVVATAVATATVEIDAIDASERVAFVLWLCIYRYIIFLSIKKR